MTTPLQDSLRGVLEASWNERYGYTAPNPRKYPYQWLWDSCFHAISWSEYRDPRALRELESLFAAQLPSGFMPNVIYRPRSIASRTLWKNALAGYSDITQPPMYGHAIRVLHDHGYDVSHLVGPARKGLNFLLRERRDPATGLLRIIHPWESGCDDLPRWDSWSHGRYHRTTWNIRKYYLLRRVKLDHGASIANPAFSVDAISFNALVAFNARELAAVTGDKALAQQADELATAIDTTWDEVRSTWVDRTPDGTSRPSSAIRTLDALLPLLVSSNAAHRNAAWNAIFSPDEFLAPYGLRAVAKSEPAYAPDGYWRGGSWAQMMYLLWVAADREGHPRTKDLARLLTKGVEASKAAEHWNPETGKGSGATPCGFSTLATVTAPTVQ